MASQQFKNWITSREILDQAKISRATLNNYIKLGILPRPVVSQDRRERLGSKQIGYFPPETLKHLEKVKQLKREGASMSEIIKQIGSSHTAPKNKDSNVLSIHSRSHDHVPETSSADKDSLKVTINDLRTPAYLINADGEINWINPEGESLFFQSSVSDSENPSDRNLYKLFFQEDFQERFLNWEEIVAFHLPFTQFRYPQMDIKQLIQGFSDDHFDFFEDKYERDVRLPATGIYDTAFDLVQASGEVQSLKVYILFFREGIFYIWVDKESHSREIEKLILNRENIALDLMVQAMPVLHAFCVLALDLQHASRLAAEMMPNEYFQLINQIWDGIGAITNRREGIHGHQSGTQGIFYFVDREDDALVMETIQTALEIKEKINALSKAWTLQKGWPVEIFMNIGLDAAQEHCGFIRTTGGPVYTSIGSAALSAKTLSEFAKSGEIWATKALIGRLAEDQLDQINFGVNQVKQEQHYFVKHSFARISDLKPQAITLSEGTGDSQMIREIPVTEIRGVSILERHHV